MEEEAEDMEEVEERKGESGRGWEETQEREGRGTILSVATRQGLLPSTAGSRQRPVGIVCNLGVSRSRGCFYPEWPPGDFPGHPVVKNLSCKAGDTGLIPGQGTKIPHATEQLSPCATTTELASHNY